MVRNFRMFYVAWFGIIVAATVLQFYLAGYGVFGFHGLNDFGPHFVVGDLIGIAILLGIGLAFAARMPWRVTIINIVLFVLMFIQATLAHTGVQGVGALHVVNGVLIFLGTIYLTREATKVVWPGSWFARPM
ncbi:MAG: hypothetical protein E6I06_13050 [Chloroflexi bacterium]|nr:MAG: hypothetical protein E6I13_06720 [Chloroflexota bacterium]TMG04602.1 MAG: hypothetical protein E6I06_13050 [Chloroflexota bacterium]TMG18162.1 MAG: hypothetical protein E6H99_12355 [Chloroflexota bacterium]TMG66973.1 MAG: hypothetical protein E6H82_07715 [Chloroflexota bacterium]